MKDFSQLEKKLKVKFKDKDLLTQAFTHRSYLNENPGFKLSNNERLEFLGDAVLELSVTDYLYKKYDDKPEGELTSWRASIVNAKTLSKVAERIGFNDFLLLSQGEEKEKGKARQYILANTIEAFIGSLYLDQGMKICNHFIEGNVLIELPFIIENSLFKDAKSFFQEKAQEKYSITPVYRVLAEKGPDHYKKFTIGVYIGKELVAEGEGLSKQEAEEQAAKNGLEKKKWNK